MSLDSFSNSTFHREPAFSRASKPDFRLGFGVWSNLWICLLLFFLAAPAELHAQKAVAIRWAAVGNSITEWSGYTGKLQTLLGPAYQVENEGVAATTLTRKGNYPYWTTPKFKQTFTFKPDIVSIKLGTNDTKPINWPSHKSEFEGDLTAMVDTFTTMNPKPRIMLCAPVPVFKHNGAWSVDGINDPVIKDEQMPILQKVSAAKKTDFIDLHTFLESRSDLFTTDGVHPDEGKAGADSIAAMMFRTYKKNVTRIACIGNSITDSDHGANAYPIKLNQLFGRDYYVLNAGHSGKTLLRKGDEPYEKSNWFKEVFKFQPNIITIKLGTNDSKSQNWDSHKNEFVTDLNWLIDTLNTIPTKPRIILCTPIPAWKQTNGTEAYGIRGAVIKDEIIPKIEQVAKERNLTLIDLHTPFMPYQKFTPDGVHPNAEGLDTLAHILFRSFKEAPVAILPEAHTQSASIRHRKPVGQAIKTWMQSLLGRRP